MMYGTSPFFHDLIANNDISQIDQDTNNDPISFQNPEFNSGNLFDRSRSRSFDFGVENDSDYFDDDDNNTNNYFGSVESLESVESFDNFACNPTNEDFQWLIDTMKGLCERAGCSDNFPSYMSQLKTRGLIPINFPKSGSNANISSMNSMNSMNSINSFNNLNVNTSGSNQNPTNGGHGGRRTRSMIRTGSPFSQFYHTIGNLGEGGYGKVMKIQNLIDRQFYALKVIRIDRSEVKMAFREVQCLAHLQSPRLVRYFNAWIEGSENSHHLSFYIQTEFVEGQSLANFLSSHSSSKIDEKVIHHLLIELTLALNDIHSAGVVHRDFRPSNVMLRPNGSIVVIDFGISSVRRVLRNQTPDIFPPVIQIPKRVGSLNIRPFDQIMIREAETPDTTIKKVGTPIYSSPQQLNGHKSTPGDDIYSLGIIMFEMLGQFRTDMEKAKMVKNLRNFNEVPASFKTDYPEETEMILKMIDKERGKRLSTVDILESDLFQRWMHEQ